MAFMLVPRTVCTLVSRLVFRVVPRTVCTLVPRLVFRVVPRTVWSACWSPGQCALWSQVGPQDCSVSMLVPRLVLRMVYTLIPMTICTLVPSTMLLSCECGAHFNLMPVNEREERCSGSICEMVTALFFMPRKGVYPQL